MNYGISKNGFFFLVFELMWVNLKGFLFARFQYHTSLYVFFFFVIFVENFGDCDGSIEVVFINELTVIACLICFHAWTETQKNPKSMMYFSTWTPLSCCLLKSGDLKLWSQNFEDLVGGTVEFYYSILCCVKVSART